MYELKNSYFISIDTQTMVIGGIVIALAVIGFFFLEIKEKIVMHEGNANGHYCYIIACKNLVEIKNITVKAVCEMRGKKCY